MAETKATWNINLNCTCPGCGEDVDLLDDPDFFDGCALLACETGTPRSTDMEVVCPECGHEFEVDCEY